MPRQPSYLFPPLQIFLGAAEQAIEHAEQQAQATVFPLEKKQQNVEEVGSKCVNMVSADTERLCNPCFLRTHVRCQLFELKHGSWLPTEILGGFCCLAVSNVQPKAPSTVGSGPDSPKVFVEHLDSFWMPHTR